MEQQEFFSQLKAAGVDTDTALERFMGNQGLYLRFLVLSRKRALHFVKMQNIGKLKQKAKIQPLVSHKALQRSIGIHSGCF